MSRTDPDTRMVEMSGEEAERLQGLADSAALNGTRASRFLHEVARRYDSADLTPSPESGLREALERFVAHRSRRTLEAHDKERGDA